MIRPGTFEDIPALIDLGSAFHQESRFRTYRYAPSKVGETLAKVIAMPDGFLWVVESDGEIIGAMAGLVLEQWFSFDRVAQDIGLFVRPDRRGGIAAARLIRHFLEWTKERGVVSVDIGVNTGIHMEKTGALFAGLGGTLMGQVYVWEQAHVH